jgi:hypothetical protein
MVHDPQYTSEWVRGARRSARQLIVEHLVWLVYELPPAPFDRRSTPSLVFESDDTVRRVRVYPSDWRVLSDHDLYALSWTR